MLPASNSLPNLLREPNKTSVWSKFVRLDARRATIGYVAVRPVSNRWTRLNPKFAVSCSHQLRLAEDGEKRPPRDDLTNVDALLGSLRADW